MITTVKTSSVVQGMPKYRSMLAGNPAYIPSSYESIATANGNGSGTTITFSSIPSTFKHLQIRGIVQGTTGGASDARIRFNSDTGTNYATHQLSGNGTAASASGNASLGYGRFARYWSTDVPAAIPVVVCDILDYASTTKNKTLRSFAGVDSNGGGSVVLYSTLWINTNAITSISITNEDGVAWGTNATFALYGIKEF